VEEMKKAGVKAIQGEEWKMEGELVLKEGKVYCNDLKLELRLQLR